MKLLTYILKRHWGHSKGVRETSAVTERSAGWVSPRHSVCHPGLVSLDHLVKMLLQWVHRVSQSLCDSLFWGFSLLVAGKLPAIPILNVPDFAPN